MESQIREYVDGLFENAPTTQRVYELKMELIQNLNDKYYDLVSEGKSPEDAYNITILGIGDINELISSLDSNFTTNYYPNNEKKKRALLFSTSIMLYILSVVPVIIMSELGINEVFGIVAMFAMIALATGLIIYNNMTKTKNTSKPETVVEEFKQWQKDKSQYKSVSKAVMSAYWPLVLSIYFLLSFTTGRWDITWIIFLIAGAVGEIIKALVDLKKQ